MASSALHPLGKNGPKVPAMGFGLIGLSYATHGSFPSDEERFAILDRAVELGETFRDTAEYNIFPKAPSRNRPSLKSISLYGDSEELLGKWSRGTGKRDSIFLTTKFGFVQGGKPFEVNSSGAYCKKACAESLKRLGIDCIDLYYMQSANPATAIGETMLAMVDLQAEGKIKCIGLSGVSSDTLRRAYKIAPVAAIQTEYSVFTREIEGPKGTNLLATCRELGVAIVVACPLGRGVLTATFSNGESLGDEKDMRPRVMPRFLEENRRKNAKIVNEFRTLADRKNCTVSQLALAWLLKQGVDIFPIPGTKKIKYLEENWSALGVVLSDTEEAEIRAFAEANEVAGGQVPEQFECYIFRDTVQSN